MIARVFLALDDATVQRSVKQGLSESDVLVHVPRSRNHLWKRVNQETSDFVILSAVYIPRPKLEMISRFTELPGAPTLVIISDVNEPEDRASLLAAGADEVLYSGLPPSSLLEVFDALIQKKKEQVHQTIGVPRMMAQPRLTDFVSNSPVMQDFVDMVRRIIPGSSSLLLQGETGVGKERLGMAVHSEGPRADGPFIAINCGALPDSLLESELFGHEEGAFTGATRARRGCFEMAHTGTIFLDEIGEMPPHVQVRLLRVLQDKTVNRVGGERPIKVDVRVMAATNRNLQDDVENGRFRKDLYYRLSVVTLTVPPLRDRREDIAELVESYLAFLRPRVGREVVRIERQAVKAMENYDWPGNVRELINVVERAMLLCPEDTVRFADLPDAVRGESGAPMLGEGIEPSARPNNEILISPDWLDVSLAEMKKKVSDSFERAYLTGLLERTGGSVGKTAALAGITARALHTKMKHHSLKKETFKNL